MWIYVFISLGYTPRGRIADSYSNSMSNILRNRQIVFQSSWTILHSHQQCMRVPISLCSHQHLLLSVFFIPAMLVGVIWYLIVVLICISLMANEVEHLFVYLLAISVTSLKKCLFRSFNHLKIGLFIFYY